MLFKSGLFLEIQKYEVEIVSNRKLERFGEKGSESSTHCPSRQGNYFCWKNEKISSYIVFFYFIIK